MVYWWVGYSYFNNEPIQTRDVVFMNAEYGSSGSFGSIIRSKYIGHNEYTDIRINFRSKPTSIHGLAHKYNLNFSYSIIQFSWLPQAVSNRLIHCFSWKFGYCYMIIAPVTNGFSTNELKTICSIVITQSSLLV